MRLRLIWAGVWLAVSGLAWAGTAAPTSVELRVEPGTPSQIRVETAGSASPAFSHVLRSTTANVVTGPAWSDVNQRAAFVTWHEDGEAERWHAFTRDGGKTWSVPRRTPMTLRLLDGETAVHQAMPPVPPAGALPADGKLFLLQLESLSLPELREELAARGVEVLQAFPHHAHVVRLEPQLAPAIRALPFVARLEPYHPWYRLEPELREWSLSPDGPARITVNVLTLGRDADAARRIAARARRSGAVVANPRPAGRLVTITVDRRELAALASDDDVLWIDRDTPKSTDMDLVRLDTGSGSVESNPGYCGAGVRGEVLDSGIEPTHQDFDGVLLHGPNGLTESHGTRVFGILFGNGDLDGDGNAMATGMLPCAQGISADTKSLGDRFTHTQQLLSSPYFASFQSNSWGSTLTTAYSSQSFELDDIAWRLDFAILQSQSNSGSQLSRPEAWAKNVISVGGIRHHDTLNLGDDDPGVPPGDCPLGGCSSHGPAADGRVKPDLAHWNDAIFTATWGNAYTADFGGTSASTPITAGVLGLILEMWADDVWGTDPQGATVFDRKPHAATLRALLINSAVQYPFTSGSPLSRFKQGWGRPSAIGALERAETSFVLDEAVALELGEWAPVKLEVPAGEQALKLTLVYADPPGTTSASLHRINDLDLELRSPTGVFYRGNFGLTTGPWSVPGGTPNTIDTVENIFVQNPLAGTWHARVRAVEVNDDAHLTTAGVDDVAFSLVATGATGLLCTPMQASFTAQPPTAVVGQAVQFTPAVSGGAPGAKSYAWDFDRDGVVDSTEEAPNVVFHEPFSGSARLTVLDPQGCPEYADQALVVDGPRLIHDSISALSEVSGNGNGVVDPGETWQFFVRLRNDGNMTATGVSAKLAAAPGNPGGILMLQDSAVYPSISPGGVALSAQRYRFKLGHGFDCAGSATFSLTSITSATPSNVYPDDVAAIELAVGGPGSNPPCSPFGSSPGRVETLEVDLDEQGDVVLSWDAGCGGTGTYSVYRGSLDGGYATAASAACDHASTSIVLAPVADGEFFFVSTTGTDFDGSYGLTGDGTERPPLAAGSCRPLDADDCF